MSETLNENMQNKQASLLLVDDDEVFCEVLAKALNKRGFNVTIANNHQQAVELASQQRPEYAIVDLRIGADSGLNVIKSLATSESGIRIVVLTGFASISTAVESIKLGAMHYLTKPAELDEIIKAFNYQQGNAELDLQSRPMSTKRMEWEHLQKVLNDYDGNISAAARAMGMHRRTLQRKLQKKPVKS
jgi:two-component system response regulator RegA